MPAYGSGHIYLFGHERPSLGIELLKKHREYRKYSAFSLGSASLILFSPTSRKISNLLKFFGSDLLFCEEWTITNGKLEKEECLFLSRQPTAPLNLGDVGPTENSIGSFWVSNEIISNFGRLYRKSQIYFPFFKPELDLISNQVREAFIVIKSSRKQIEELLPPNSPHPSPEVDTCVGRLRTDLDECLVYLVGLNSALVYALTQSVHGTPLIKDRFGLIQQHSLLGTGTAWVAIAKLCLSITTTIRNSKIIYNLQNKFTNDGQDHSDSSHDSDSGVRARIVHFSGRYGFGEEPAAFTFPVQSLQAAALNEWNLLTCSHEIMHGHVREMLATALVVRKGGKSLTFQESVNHWAERFRKHLEYVDHTQSLLEIRSISNEQESWGLEFVHHCAKLRSAEQEILRRTAHFADTSAPSDLEYMIYLQKDQRLVQSTVRHGLNLFEEIIVHCLDFRYFYGLHAETYLRSIWISWSAYPRIIDRMEWYLLRSLVSIATRTGDDIYTRLRDARKTLFDVLDDLYAEGYRRPLIVQAKQFLHNPSEAQLTWLTILFECVVEFADFSLKEFFSAEIQRSMSHEILQIIDEDEGGRSLARSTPLGLVFASLCESTGEHDLTVKFDENTLSRDSAKLFIALASYSNETT